MEKERLHNFLKDDLGKLKENVDILIDLCNNHLGHTMEKEFSDDLYNNPVDKIDEFFHYWEQHIDKLK